MVIEEYYTDSLKTAYVVAEENKRGVHMVDAGKSEIILHQRYQKNAEALQERYPYTADIYLQLVMIINAKLNMKESVQKMNGRKNT